MEYYVYMTNDCNMNCAYCSVLFDTIKNGVPLTPQYSFEQLDCFVSKVQKKFNDNVADIYFFGGEPTVEFQRIKELIKAFDKPHDYKVNYIMHTNGLLIPETPEKILNNITLTILSFNYEIMYNDGFLTPYFGKMIRAIERIKSVNNTPIIGRITVSPKTSLFTECCLICNFVDYVYWQIDNCLSLEQFDTFQIHYKNDIELLFKYWFENLKKGIFLKFVPFMSVIRNLIVKPMKPTKFYCGYGTSMIYIQTNGKCYACCDNVISNSHYIGDIYSDIQFSDNNLNRTICKECEYITLCGGRCGRMHKDFPISSIKQYCHLNKYMFDIIKAKFDEIRNIIVYNSVFSKIVMDPMISYTEYTA